MYHFQIYAILTNTKILKNWSQRRLSLLSQNNNALLDLVGKVNSTKYIEGQNRFQAKDQDQLQTCYAHALSAVFMCAMSRIYHIEGGVPQFDETKKLIIKKNQKLKAKHNDQSPGGKTFYLAKKYAKKYRLQYQEVDFNQALQALNAGRPQIAKIWLDAMQWTNFFQFFRQNPKQVLTFDELIKTCEPNQNQSQGGHALILMSFNSKGLQFLDSRGSHWGDSGFFRVQFQCIKVMNLQLMDVFWNEKDLYQSEKLAYMQEQAQIIKQRTKDFQRLRKKLKIPCPKCQQLSFINDYQGNFIEAKCPKCQKHFEPDNLNNYAKQLFKQYGKCQYGKGSFSNYQGI